MEIAYWYYANIQKTVLLFLLFIRKNTNTPLLLHAEKTSLSIYKGSEVWFLCLLYTFCPHILNSDFWVFPQSDRVVAIEGSNMLMLWSQQTFSLYQKPRWRTNSSHTIKNGKNEVPPSASSQNITFVFFKYFIKNIPHIPVNMWIIDMQNLSPALTVWSELGYYGDGLSCIFQSCGCLLVCCTGQVHPIHLRIQTHTISS